MGISQKQIDAEIASLQEIRRNVSLFKKAFFPNDIARELDSYIDNYHIYRLFRAIDNCKESWVDFLDEFRDTSKILRFYYKYVEYLEGNIVDHSRAEVFTYLILAADEQAALEYIISYCVAKVDKLALLNFVANYADNEPITRLFEMVLPSLELAQVHVAWAICTALSQQQVYALLLCVDYDSKLQAFLKLEPYLQSQVCVDSIIGSSNPMLTVSLIQQLYTDGYFSDDIVPYTESLLVKSLSNTEVGYDLLQSTCTGLKLLTKSQSRRPEGFIEKVLQYAEIIFNRKTDILWQYVPLNILEQLYQVIFSICEDRDIAIDGLSEIEAKQSMVVSELLGLEQVLFSPVILLSAENDDLLYTCACVAFTQMGVCLNDVRSRTQCDIKNSQPLLGFKFLPFLIRANSSDYNHVVLSYCRLPEIKEVLTRSDNKVSGITVADVLETAKYYNQELYHKLRKINRQTTPTVSIAELSFVISGATKQADEQSTTKLRCYTY